LVTVRELFDEIAQAVLGLPFATVSLIDLVRDGDAKELLRAAEDSFRTGDFESCLINCRKAIFTRIECAYDVAPFRAVAPPGGLTLRGLGSRAPFFARNQDYVARHIKDATDYIVLDHNDVEMELMKSGMDRLSFWNVWRLTPEVYRLTHDGEWVVKRDLRKLERDGIQERAEYVLDTTVNLFVAADQRRAGIRAPERRNYYVTLRTDSRAVYEKADLNSPVIGTTPEGVTEIIVDFVVPALHGEGMFWHVVHQGDGGFIWGYIPEDALVH
jgi:hypothetical protein